MQNKAISKIFLFLLCFFTFCISSSAIVITSLGDRFDCLPYEIVTDIFNKAVTSSLYKKNFPKKNYKFITKETLQVEECLVFLDTFSILSRSFYALTKEYKNTALKETFTIYEITQKQPLINSLIIAKKIDNPAYYSFHKEIFNAIQWFSFYSKLRKALEKYQRSGPLVKASKNVLKYSIECMNEEIIQFLNSNTEKEHPIKLDPNFNYQSERKTTLHKLHIHVPQWFNNYLKNPIVFIDQTQNEEKIKSIGYRQYIKYTAEDTEKISIFLDKARENFLKYSEETDIVKIVTSKPLLKKWVPIRKGEARPTFLIMQFLISLYEGNLNNKNKEICLLLQRLSNYYWNKRL